MNNKQWFTPQKLSLFFVLVVMLFGISVIVYEPTVLAQSTLQPTETAVGLTIPTPLPTSTSAALPAVDWLDVSVYKKAMKPGRENEIEAFVDANRYLIQARLSFEEDAIIRGAERVRFTNRTGRELNEIVFRLYPNTPVLVGRMNVSRVSIGRKIITAQLSQQDSVMTVPLTQPLSAGRAIELTLDFSVIMTRGLDASYGRFGYVHDVVSATAWYPTLSVYDQKNGWWGSMPSPNGDPAYTETGLYDVRLTTPSDVTVAMSGSEVETTNNADGTVTHRDVTGPMRDHAFMASRRYAIASTEADGTRINVLHYKDPADSSVDGTAAATKYAVQALSTYNKAFGDYPYVEFDVVENPTPTGVEFPGLIQIAERAWIAGQGYLEIVIAHEVGHQWFYAMVGDNQVEHPWLDESLTSYTEFVYIRAFHPEQATTYIQDRQRNYNLYIGAGFSDQPVNLPVSAYSDTAYGLIVYTKGPLFLVELERQLGQDTVYRMLRNYFREYRYLIATSQSLKKSFEATAGKDLTPLFQKWIGSLNDDAPLQSIPTSAAAGQ